GQPTRETARAAAAALEEAVTLARRGELDAVVTGPIHKARMYEAGFKFPGQTEFFAERCGVKNFAMCLIGGKLTVALVTTHIPLKLHAFYSGVNVTLGLPFPRTSPDHGTAFEIAGKGIARPDSIIEAITLATELAQARRSS